MFSSLTENAAKGTAALAKGDLERGAKKLRNKAKKVVDDIEDKVDEYDENVFTDMSDTANKAGMKMRSFFDDVASGAQENVKRIEDEINSNPVRSSLIALSVGVVIGALFRRR